MDKSLNGIIGSLLSIVHRDFRLITPKQVIDRYLQKHPADEKMVVENIFLITKKLSRKIKKEYDLRHDRKRHQSADRTAQSSRL